MKKIILSLFLTFFLCLSLLPTAAPADEPDIGAPAIRLGVGGLQSPTASETETDKIDYTPNSYVYFGAIGETPIQWRVLDADKTSDDNVGVFLLSEQVLGRGVPFCYDGSSNKWDGSEAQIWCGFFAGAADPAKTAFSEAENNAIRATYKEETDTAFGVRFSASKLNGDKVFFLSGREAEHYLGSYDRAPQLIALDVDGKADAWWLRSPYPGDEPGDVQAGFVQADGAVTADAVVEGHGVRPAFNLDADKVLFTSPAQFESNVGLEPVGTYSGREWKLTLKDDDHSAFNVKTTGTNDYGLTFSYQNARIGENEYLSAIVTDADGSITHYGRVQSKAVSESDSIQFVALPVGFDKESDKIYVFNEQDNGDYRTNYASALVELSLEAEGGEEVSINSITAVGDGSGNWLNGAAWAPAEKSNHMTETPSGSGIYEITYTGIEAGEYQVAFVANDSWSCKWGAEQYAENVPLSGNAVYNDGNIPFTVEADNSTVKLVLDLSGFDFDTEQGATYSITITPPGGGSEEPSAAEVTSGGKTTGYPTLADAFADVKNGDTVRLLDDVTEKSAIELSTADINFDLNGHTAPDCSLTLQSGAGLTITDSSEEKTGSFGDVTMNASGSLILDGAAVGKITVADYFAGITLKAGTKFAGYQNPKGMVLAEWIEDGCCIVSDGSGAVSLVNNDVKSQDGSFTVTKAPATFAAPIRSTTLRYNGLMPEDVIPEIRAEDESVSSVDMQWYCWSTLNDDQLAPIANVGTIDLNDPSKTTRGAVNSDYIFRVLGFDYGKEMRGVFCVLTAKDSGGNELWSTVLHGYTFTLERANLSEGTVTATDLVYTPGKTQTLEFQVKYILAPLYEGFDYEIQKNSNQGENAGEYTLVLEGMGNYEGTLSCKWKVKPCELTDIAALTKVYDGTTDLPDEITFAYDDGTVTLTGAGDKPDYIATGEYSSAGAGTSKYASVNVELKNGNYTFANGEKSTEFILDSADGKAAITKAEAPAPKQGEMTVFNNLEKEYTYDDLTQLLTELPAGQRYGELSYSVKNGIDTKYIPDTDKILFNHVEMSLPVEKVDTETEGSIGILEITVTSDNFEDFTLRINVSAVNKYVPTGTPTLSSAEITYGDPLNNITLSGDMAYGDQTVEGIFGWVDGTVAPDAGHYNAKWKFIPDNKIYADVTGTATITVNPAQLTGVSVRQSESLTYNGAAQRASVETSATAFNEQSVTFTYCDTQEGDYSETVPAFTDAGEYTVYYKAAAPNHETFSDSFKVIIAKSDPICAAPVGVTAVYGDTLDKITLTNPDGNTPGKWSWANGTQQVGKVGERDFEAKFTPDDKINYNSVDNIAVTVTVIKAGAAVSVAPAAKSLTYNGEAQYLLNAGTTADGTILYSLSKDKDYSEYIPTGTKAGKYTVWYKVGGDSNHRDTDPVGIEVIIARQPVAIPKADTKQFTYNGWEQIYTLAENENYTIDGNVKKNSGLYKVTVSLKDTENFVWSDNTDEAKTFEFVIDKAVVTITVINKSVYTRSKAPRLSRPVLDEDYTVSGLIGRDTLITAPELTYDPAVPDLSKTGEAAVIRASGASAGENYNIVYENGKLLVIAHPFSGGYYTSYSITVAESENGSAVSNRKSADRGKTVTITVTPDEGCTLETITVIDKYGSEIELNAKGDGKYTFIMPASAVTVKATFMDDNEMLNFFTDVKASDYFYDAVLWAAQEGITTGTDAVHFSPNQPCTRAQIVTFLWRAFGCPVVNYAMNMTDVPEDAYYAEAVRWALSEGITTGTTKTAFSPSDPCTRAQAVTFLCRSQRAKAEGGREVRRFADFDSIPAYAVDAVQWALENDVTAGTGDGNFTPNAPCTRAQIVTFLYRLYLGK